MKIEMSKMSKMSKMISNPHNHNHTVVSQVVSHHTSFHKSYRAPNRFNGEQHLKIILIDTELPLTSVDAAHIKFALDLDLF